MTWNLNIATLLVKEALEVEIDSIDLGLEISKLIVLLINLWQVQNTVNLDRVDTLKKE